MHIVRDRVVLMLLINVCKIYLVLFCINYGICRFVHSCEGCILQLRSVALNFMNFILVKKIKFKHSHRRYRTLPLRHCHRLRQPDPVNETGPRSTSFITEKSADFINDTKRIRNGLAYKQSRTFLK